LEQPTKCEDYRHSFDLSLFVDLDKLECKRFFICCTGASDVYIFQLSMLLESFAHGNQVAPSGQAVEVPICSGDLKRCTKNERENLR
jgi:hypothetical protein